jgi:aminopeptidase N
MIHTLLGPDLFRKGSDLYFERHDGEAVTIEDFVAAMAEVSGKDFSQFMNWYKQAGTPAVRVSEEYDAEAQRYSLHFSQSCRSTPECENKQPYLIPVKMGLVGADGDMALDDLGNTEKVIEITNAEQSLTFENIPAKPVPSLFREFSAPVKWQFAYDRNDLLFLMANDSDSFNRWEACNQLALNILKEMIAGRQKGESIPLDSRLIEAYRSVLADPALDKAMIALMLSLPTESYLSEQMDIIPVKEIHEVRLAVRRELASALRNEFLSCYRELQSDAPYKPEPEQIAQRSLKNMVLAYLSLLDEQELIEMVYQQATTANNMTDCHSALVSLVNSPVAAADKLSTLALEDFYSKWKDESLAINLWLQVQAGAMTPGGLERVKALMEHEAFDIKNPNRVRSLIGMFCSVNAVNFHREDGAGYEFLADRIIELNGINPQIAARQLTPLTRWRKYPEQLADKMTGQLRRILGVDGLSPDVYEVVSKSLAE